MWCCSQTGNSILEVLAVYLGTFLLLPMSRKGMVGEGKAYVLRANSRIITSPYLRVLTMMIYIECDYRLFRED